MHTAIAAARAAGVPLKIACEMQEPAGQLCSRAVVASLLGTDVEFVGEVGGDQKLDLLAGARCLLNPRAGWPPPPGPVRSIAPAAGSARSPCRRW